MRVTLTAAMTAVIFAACPIVASAADLPMKAPMMMPIAPSNWSGWYIGANAGYSWGHSSVNYAQDPGNFFGVSGLSQPLALSTNLSPGSFIGGGQLGFNYQAGAWVFGFETDFQWRDRTNTTAFVLNSTSDMLTLSDEQKWVGTVRGRLGWSPPSMSNWLFYGTGGLAYGSFAHSVTQFCNAGCNFTRTFTDSVTKTGWTVGGGVEWALNRNWSLGAEYLYMDFGTDTLRAGSAFDQGPGLGPIFTNTTVSFHETSQIARMKLNYKFGDLGLH